RERVDDHRMGARPARRVMHAVEPVVEGAAREPCGEFRVSLGVQEPLVAPCRAGLLTGWRQAVRGGKPSEVYAHAFASLCRLCALFRTKRSFGVCFRHASSTDIAWRV